MENETEIIEMRQCNVCQDRRPPMRFDGDSPTCRECINWNRRPFALTSQAHAQTNSLQSNPAYKRYMEDWRLQHAQLNNAHLRAIGKG